jgi:hypothetical protein
MKAKKKILRVGEVVLLVKTHVMLERLTPDPHPPPHTLTLYFLPFLNCRNCKRLREFEEI